MTSPTRRVWLYLFNPAGEPVEEDDPTAVSGVRLEDFGPGQPVSCSLLRVRRSRLADLFDIGEGAIGRPPHIEQSPPQSYLTCDLTDQRRADRALGRSAEPHEVELLRYFNFL